MSDETKYLATIEEEAFYDITDDREDALAVGYAYVHGTCSVITDELLFEHIQALISSGTVFSVDISNSVAQLKDYILVELPAVGGFSPCVTAIPVAMVHLIQQSAPTQPAPATPVAPALTPSKVASSPIYPNLKQKKETPMGKLKLDLSPYANAMHNYVSKMFTQVDNVVMDFQTGLIGIVGADTSLITAKAEDGKLVIQSNPFALLSMPVPAFAFRKKLGEVKVGDIVILENKEPAFVSGVTDTEIKVVKGNETGGTLVPIASTMFGSGVLVVQSFFNGGQVNPMMYLLLANGDGAAESGLKEMLPLMLMGQAGGSLNQMLPLMLMSGGSNDMMQTMLMMQMIQGQNGQANPLAGFGDMFSGMFGQPAKQD